MLAPVQPCEFENGLFTDSLLCQAVEQQIKSFGQTPSQLLHDPHVPRLLPETQVKQQCFENIPSNFLSQNLKHNGKEMRIQSFP